MQLNVSDSLFWKSLALTTGTGAIGRAARADRRAGSLSRSFIKDSKTEKCTVYKQ